MNRTGLLQACRLLVIAGVIAVVAAAGWRLVSGDGFLIALGIALIALAGLVGVTGASDSSRLGTADIRALIGSGPERGPRDVDGSLTGVGVFTLVSLPLVVLGFVVLALGGQ